MNNRKFWIEEINPLINDSLNTKTGGVILYGARDGVTTAWQIYRLRQAGIDILCVADADINKQGNTVSGIPIVAPESLTRYDLQTCVIVLTVRHCLAITDKLNQLGFFNILYAGEDPAHTIDAAAMLNAYISNNHEQLDGLLKENASQISEVRQFFQCDSRSTAVFEAKLDSLYYGKHIPLESLYDLDQYFPRDIIELSEREVFVDCGALDGGTIVDFTKKANNEYEFIYSFEPDPAKFYITEAIISTGKIERCELYNLGVFDHESEVSFLVSATGSSRISNNGNIKIRTTTLDAILYDSPHRPTFIKMDIEGAELAALNGAKRIIARDRPKLAISAYHGYTHIWEIPHWIKSNFPDYKIYLRQHGSIFETVCYAVP